MSRVREVPIHLTRLEARELGRALQAADRDLAKSLRAYGEGSGESAIPWSVLDAWTMRRARIAAILDKLERAIGVPVSELGL